LNENKTFESSQVKIGNWWFPFDDKKCRRHFEEKGLQIDHLEKALERVTDWSLAVDGGAHVGSWTRILAGCFKRVAAYEMAPDTFACLKKNTADLKNVRLVNAAIGHKRGRAGVNDVGHTLGRCVAEGDQVPMLRLDDENLEALGFLKLDLEGYEYFGLKGAERAIRRFRPVILVEEKGHGQRYEVAAGATTEFLESLGYIHVFRMKPDNLFVPGSRNPIAAFFQKKKFKLARKIKSRC